GGPRNLPTHQQTLRGTLAWSFDLLTPEEQVLFVRLGVFVGGCTLEAVAGVCYGLGDLTLDLLDGLTMLIDQSLLQQTLAPDGEVRFTMLETIREYALEQLAARGEVDWLQQRHAAYFLALAQEVEPMLLGPKQGACLAQLEVEYNNLQVVLAWSQATVGSS